LQQAERSVDHPGASVAEAGSTFYYGWVIVAVAFVVLGLITLIISSFPLFYVPVLENFNWSRGSTAIMMSIFLVLSGLAAPFAGGLIDRFGPRRVMPLGAFVTGCALLWLSRSSALWHFYVGFGIVAALGSSMLYVVPVTTIVSNWFARHRGTAIGIVTAAPGTSQLLLLPLLQYLINRIGWRNAYLLLGAVLVLIPTTLIRLFLYGRPSDRGLSVEDEMRSPKHKGDHATVAEDAAETRTKTELVVLDKEWAETEWTIWNSIRTIRFWALTLVMAMFTVGFFLISIQLVAYLQDKGYSSMVAASVIGLQGFVNIVGTLLGGFVGDRWGRERTLTLSVAIFIVCIVLLAIGGLTVSPAIVYAFAVVYGIGFGMAFPTLMASAADLFQGQHFGSILGIIALGGYLGAALGAWLSGFFFDLTRAYYLNFIVAALVMVISAVLIWKASPGQVRVVRIAHSK
jgi:MFS family permease